MVLVREPLEKQQAILLVGTNKQAASLIAIGGFAWDVRGSTWKAESFGYIKRLGPSVRKSAHPKHLNCFWGSEALRLWVGVLRSRKRCGWNHILKRKVLKKKLQGKNRCNPQKNTSETFPKNLGRSGLEIWAKTPKLAVQ